MPLKKGSSRKTISTNIKEFKAGPRNKATARKSGKKAAQKQAEAVALKEARKSKKKPAAKAMKASAAASARNREGKPDKAPLRRKRNRGRS
jgi:hypothetical protein